MNHSQQEQTILKFWDSIKAFERSVSRRPKSRRFVFYEGPPTANGRPGLHHVEARSFKDIICRYKTMRGYRVERRAGWDTHGLPVETQIERELGFKNKRDIERYGIEKFNQKSRDSVWRYKMEWENLTRRMGFWLDMENPYITYEPLYMETLWWILSYAHKQSLLYEDYRVMPYCARCGASLSSHEVAQGYQDVTDQSVYIKFKIKNPIKHQLPTASYFLVWTTTPWTLPGNAALAVGAKMTYVLARQGDEHYIVARELYGKVLSGEHKVVKEISGAELQGIEYEVIFDSLKDTKEKKYFVIGADFVSTEEGTGIVHIAPMYGEDDFDLGKKHNLPFTHTVNEDGMFNALVQQWTGLPAKKSDLSIIEWLKANHYLYRQQAKRHTYPFCWRCGEALIYYATNSWFIKMSVFRKQLIAANKKIHWVPEYMKEGRFGDWLRELKDWSISRSRYWGTPLPVWRCQNCGRIDVIGSRKDLKQTTRGKNSYFLLRHGYSERNHLDVLAGSYPERGQKYYLKPQGIHQVEKAARQLKRMGGVDLIFASPIMRTRQTAEIVARELGLKVHYEKSILEIATGIYEGRPAAEYHAVIPTTQLRFIKAPSGAETLAEVQRRMVNFVRELENKFQGKRILIVSHGDPLWVLESAMEGLTIDEAAERRNKNYPQVGELRKLDFAFFPYNKNGELDLHRPYVDNITWPCKKCVSPDGLGISLMRRVNYLVDVWFDSGAMPFASQHYPFENKTKIEKGTYFPADFIAEAHDQTRGWFYTLLAVGAILGRISKYSTYKNVISLGHVLDERGQKMSKSKGNIVDPLMLGEKYGMDAVRWYFFTVNGPGDVKRFSERDVKEREQKFISTFFNSFIFLNTYAAGTRIPQKFNSNNILDIWAYARLKELATFVRQSLDSYHVVEAARALEAFMMNDFSNWYVRRSRERLARSNAANERVEAAQSFSYILAELAKLTAPFTPFLAEKIWQDLHPLAKASVHWQDYPKQLTLSVPERTVLKNMNYVRLWAEDALRVRAGNTLKVRQPLAGIVVPQKIPKEFQNILCAELNIKEVFIAKKGPADWAHGQHVWLNTTLTPQLILEGRVRDLIRAIQDARKDSGLKPQDKIRVVYLMPSDAHRSLAQYEKEIADSVNASSIVETPLKKGRFLAKRTIPWSSGVLELGIIKGS